MNEPTANSVMCGSWAGLYSVLGSRLVLREWAQQDFHFGAFR